MIIKNVDRHRNLFSRLFSLFDKLKLLRDLTGSPIIECKKALEESKQDVEKAKEILELKGFAHIKPVGRRYKDGFVSVLEKEKGIQLLVLNCETYNIAKTKDFLESIKNLMGHLGKYPKEDLSNEELKNFMESQIELSEKGKTVKKNVREMLALLSANTLENCSINNIFKRSMKKGIVIGSYIHAEIEPTIGTKAGIVVIK